MPTSTDSNGFTLYSSYRDFLTILSDSDRGQLLLALFDFCDGINTSACLPSTAQMAFAFISRRIDEEMSRHRDRCRTNRDNAVRRWAARPASAAPSAASEDG